ncbi:putative serine protease K12H4.7 [Melanaphis sacchari]|nr:putative serine protease K12H4.7 [Melanaphis sacchari]
MKSIFCVLWPFIWLNSSANSMKNILIGLGEPNEPESLRAMEAEDEWFIQKLNHFNHTDNRTWKQRYQVNSDFYKNDGPVFLMIGGEGKISAKWMRSGAWIDYAKEFNALCFQLEHRYYGESHPTEDLSTSNLVYLNSEQALADLAEFIVNIKIKYKIPPTAKWVAFGGSYPGSLAAWLRMKYPHLIHMAVSTSGPLLAKIDFREYFMVVENALATYKPECVSQIKEANQMINYLLKTDHGAKIIEKKFQLCYPLDRKNHKDVSYLFEILADNFAGIVQYNKNNRFYSNPERSSVTLETLCDIMVNKSIPTPLDRYAAVNSKILSLYKTDCQDNIYSQTIDFYVNTSWSSDAAGGARQWTYQTCTEFGFYQTSSQDDHVFGHNFPIQFFIDLCKDIFGKSYNLELLTDAVERTNNMFGELNIRESRVLFVHGSVDPWHALGITHARTKNNVAIFINGTAHCANMYPPAPTDPPELTQARTTIREYLKEWLAENDFVDLDQYK